MLWKRVTVQKDVVPMKIWNSYTNLKILGGHSLERLSECDHTTAQDTLFSLYWEFGLFGSSQTSKD